MFEVPDNWLEMDEAEQDAWVEHALISINAAPVPRRIPALVATGAEFRDTDGTQARDDHGRWSAGGGHVGNAGVSREYLDTHENVDTADMGMRLGTKRQRTEGRAEAAKIDWDNVKVTALPKDAILIATEKSVKTKYIKRVLDGEPLREGYEPQLVQVAPNTFLVYDGHHRMAMHAALGNDNSSLKVRIANKEDE